MGPGAEQSTILNLSIETQNIQMGEDILNTIMLVYDSLNVEDKNRISNNTLSFIDDRLEALKDSLGGVENKMLSFIEHNKAYDIGTQSRSALSLIEETKKTIDTKEVQMQVLDWLVEYLTN